jgi:serine/threonine protein phosphatase PrpC
VLLASLGDSRCYVFRGKQVMARSQDHSLVQRFIDAGLYPAARLRVHPRRTVLYASLGANEEGAEPYVLEPAAPIQAGDGMLVCSDGVWELLEDDELGELHASSDTVEQWRDRLLQALQARMPERHDNYSAYLLRCVPAREAPSPGSGA